MSNFSFNSLLRQMAEKCGGAASSATETPVRAESPMPELKDERLDEIKPEPIQEPTPSTSRARILSSGEIKETEYLKAEPKEEPGPAIITAQIVSDDKPLKIAAPPPGTRKIVIKSNGNAIYSAPDDDWRPRYPVHRADDIYSRFERETGNRRIVQTNVKPTRGVFLPVRRTLPNILRPSRPITASMALKNQESPYVRPNQQLRGAFFQRDRTTDQYFMYQGKQLIKPDWTYPNMIALCILCSDHGYVSTPDLYNFIEYYFPWYDTSVTRSYRSSLRNALSRFCDKYLPEQNGHRSTSWTLRESRLEGFKAEVKRFLTREHSMNGVRDYEELVTLINWERPAIVADSEATNHRGYRETRRLGGEAATNQAALWASGERMSPESSSVSREVSPEGDMFKQVAYCDSDQEYEVEPAEIDDANDYEKPEWKHPHMLALGLLSFGDGSGTVQDLYDFITKFFPYYATTAYWKSSARNSLCNSRYFTKFEDERHNVGNRSCLYKIREDQLATAISDIHKFMSDPSAEAGVRNFDVLKNFIDQKLAGTEGFDINREFSLRMLTARQHIFGSGEITDADIKLE